MTFFDPRHPERMTADQQKQYNEFLKAYPQLASKMDTSRELNTPLVQAASRGEVQGKPLPTFADGSVNYAELRDDEDDFPNLEAIEAQQKQQPQRFRDRPLGTMNIAEEPPEPSLKQDAERERHFREKLRAEREAPTPPRVPPSRTPPPSFEEPPPPPKKKVKFSPVGKRHPVLQRMRESLGMEELERRESIEIQGVTYTMSRLVREEITKSVAMATAKAETDAVLRSHIETAIVAFSVREIDGVETPEVFEVPAHDYSLAKDREAPLTVDERKARGAKLLFDFLTEGPTELTESLLTFYDQNYPPVNLLSADTSLALCPASGCNYRAIIPSKAVRFCPLHGDELRREETLPNPS